MPTTPNRQYPYPALSSANDPPRDFQLLAEALDADVNALMTASPIAPVYAAGWGDYNPDNPVFQGVLATRSAAGLVGLSGMFARIGSTLNTATAQTVFTLPEGYRPGRRILIILTGYTGTTAAGGTNQYVDVRVDILTTGVVQAQWIAANTWAGATSGNAAYVSLAGLSYVAAS